MYETVIENSEKAVLALMGLYYRMKSEIPEATDDLEKVELSLSSRNLRLCDNSINSRIRYGHWDPLDPRNPLEAFLLIPNGAPIVVKTSLAKVLNALSESKTERVKLSIVTGEPACELKLEDIEPSNGVTSSEKYRK
jgi:hypothetical protein